MRVLWDDRAWEEYLRWSRRIDDVNRIVYKVEGDMVIIASCRSHYDN